MISLRSRDASRRTALATIRGVHSAIFAIELAAIGWLVYTGIVGRGDRTVGIAAGLVAGEGLVWLANDRVCPLTPLAERVGAERGSVSDIWLPEPIARTIPQWSIPLVAAAIALHSRRILRAGATPRPSESERPR